MSQRLDFYLYAYRLDLSKNLSDDQRQSSWIVSDPRIIIASTNLNKFTREKGVFSLRNRY
jgi:hypothetical protein